MLIFHMIFTQIESLKPLMSMSDGRFAVTEILLWTSIGFWEPRVKSPTINAKAQVQMQRSVYEARQIIEFIYAQAAAPMCVSNFVSFPLLT